MCALARRRQRRRRCYSDEGFTLLELVVATSLLAVGIVGVVAIMMGSLGVADAGRMRSRAVAIATEQIEALRAKPYAQLLVADGVTEDDVQVGESRFHVQRAVTWADDGPATDAYKSVTVQVTWTDRSGTHEVHQSSLVYPGGLGPYGATPVVPAVAGGTPAAPTLAVATALTANNGVELVWTPPVLSVPLPSTYVVQYSTDASFATYQEVTATIPALTPFVRIEDLAPGTTYHFRVASRAANGNRSTGWAYAYNLHTAASSAATCSVGTASVTPSAVPRHASASGGGLTTIPTVSVNLSGSCSSTTLRMRYEALADGSGTTVALSGTGGVRSGQLGDSSQRWSLGDHEILVLDASGATRSTVRLVVCDPDEPVCP